ncbi:MAG TPA: hypothetical protein VK196_17255 [Magnetospirillum sp.]|nr:hypothetical protein [Magnetospirillum sp.]
MRRTITVIAAGLVSVAVGTAALAQQQQGRGPQNQHGGQQGSSMNSLPPALQAAVLSGNPTAIDQAINTLAGGNPQRMASLAEQVVTAAEKLLATNPQAAIAAASAALERVQPQQVVSSSPSQVESVTTIAARILVSPVVVAQFPTQAAELGSRVLATATATNNPTLMASAANQVVSVAEKLVATQPAAAIALAGAAVESVKTAPVTNSAPQGALSVVTTAARIIVNPSIQAINPQVVGQIAATSVQVATNPAVYASSPNAALAVASNAYSAASSQSVAAANPNALSQVVQGLVQASKDTSLNVVNPTNGVAINEILEKKTGQPNGDQKVDQPNERNNELDDRASAS